MTAIADRRANGIRTRNRPAVPGAPFIPDLEKGAAGGVATLDETTILVPANQLGTGAPTGAKALLGDQSWGDIATQVELNTEAATRAADDLTLAAGITAGDALALKKASNLSDVANAGTSRTNLGLGDSATKNVGAIAGTVCAGDDARLSDTRTPTDNTVATAKLQNDAVTYAKMQNVSATDKVLGRSTAGAGDVEEIACTAAARSILDDATIADILATLGISGATKIKFGRTNSAADGASITHGLGTTPNGVLVTDATAGVIVTAHNLGATTFDVERKNHDGTAAAANTIFWVAFA